MHVLYDNCIRPIDDVNMPVSSGSFLYGLNVFEGMKLFRTLGHLLPLHMYDHLDRLELSAAAVGWKIDRNKILDDIRMCCEYAKSDTYFRVIIFSNTSWADTSNFETIILFHPIDAFKNQSFKCSTVNLMKGEHKTLPATIKAGANYINSRYGIIEASKSYGGYPIFIDKEGFLTETGGAALVFEFNKSLFTYPCTGNTLDSITLKILKKLPCVNILDLPVHKTLISSVTGCIMVGTSVDIAPIIKIDDYRLSNSLKIANHLTKKYKKYIIELDNETN